MTNEEKAKELGKKYSNPCQGMGDCEFEATQAAIEMGEWKNKQCPSKNVIRKILDIAYDHQYTDKDGMHNLKFEAEEVIEHWNEVEL